MNKEEGTKTRYCVQWDAHARHMSTILCSLMEHQSLVDLAICCGNNTIHAHKCVLAANSPYFREQLEKNTTAEQVIINGVDFTTVKSIVEFMYCGETNILDENLKYVIAMAKLFQMRGLQILAADRQDLTEGIHIPPPIFISKKPKYPTANRPYNTLAAANVINKTFAASGEQFVQKKVKRKYIRSEAERACAKEAAASRLALEALQKELSGTPQVSSFVIEESCTETTVENFIPHGEEAFIENINDIQNVQIVNYADLNNTVYSTSGHIVSMDKPIITSPIVQYNMPTSMSETSDKLKHIIGSNGNVEIMFKTSDGKYVTVTDDVFDNIKGTIQYQVIDENGQPSEYHILEDTSGKTYETVEQYMTQPVKNIGCDETFVSVQNPIDQQKTVDYQTTIDKTIEEDTPTVSINDSLKTIATPDDFFTKNDDMPNVICEETNKPEDIPSIDITNTNENVETKTLENAKNNSNEMDDDCFMETIAYIPVSSNDTKTNDVNPETLYNLVNEENTSNVNDSLTFYPMGDSLFNITNRVEENNEIIDDGSGDSKLTAKRSKLAARARKSLLLSPNKCLPFSENLLSFDGNDDTSCIEFSPRRTRSNLKFGMDDDVTLITDTKDSDLDEFKGKRIMPNRKKK